MFPHEELTRLAAQKIALRREIALCRVQCTHAAARVAQPLEIVDRALAIWRKLSPIARIAAVPLGFIFKRILVRRTKVAGSLMSWAPLVTGMIRGMASAVSSRA
jgi:hypothetical protein